MSSIFIISLLAIPLLLVILVYSNRIFDRVWDDYIEPFLERFLTEKVPALRPSSPHHKQPGLQSLMTAYKKGNFDLAENILSDLPEDYRGFGLRMLSEMGSEKMTEKWLNHSDSSMAETVMAMFYINQAWLSRGDGFGDTVSDKRAIGFHERLQKAQKILSATKGSKKGSKSALEADRMAALITTFKGLSAERELIHRAFQRGVSISPHHIGLHEAYFDAISPKWGGTDEEISHYLQHILPAQPELLSDIIRAMYYRDVLHVKMVSDPDTIREIRNFVIRVSAQNLGYDDLHRVTLYEYMSDIARIESYALEERFEQLYDECC